MANLLLIDDDFDVVDTFGHVLRALGHVIRTAGDGLEALARLAERKPDVIITDLEMPLMGGQAMALEILARDAGAELIPIVLTSGVRDLWRVADLIGTPYFLTKPFGIDELVATLNLALSERTAPHHIAAVLTKDRPD
jgi:CheY-like chemotaxis protein